MCQVDGMRQSLRIFRVVFLLAVIASPLAYARDMAPQVRGQQMRDFVRLTFEWPESTLFTAKTSGNDVIITFDRKTNLNMGAVLKQLNPYVTKAERRSDGKTIVLTLDKPHRIRTFVSDNISGIDLLDVKAAATKQVAEIKPLTVEKKAAEKKPTAKQIAAKKAAEKKLAAKAKEKTKVAKNDDANRLGWLAPAAGEAAETKPTEVVAEKKEAVADAVKEEAPKTVVAAEATPKEAAAEDAPKIAPSAGAAKTEVVLKEVVKEDAPAPAPPAEVVKTEAAPKESAPADAPKADAAPKDVVKKEVPAKEEASPAKEAASETPPADASTADAAAVVAVEEVKPGAEPAKEKASANANPIDEAEAGPVGTLRHDTGVSMLPMGVDDDISEDAKEGDADATGVASPSSSVEMSQDDPASQEPLVTNKIVVSADADGATLRFPLKERTAMAVFIRVNMLWVVFDKKVDFDLSDFESLPPQTIVGKAIMLPNDKGTVLQIPISDNIYPTVRQQAGKLDVAILLSANKVPPAMPMEITANTEPPDLPNIFVPALEIGNTLEAKDPSIGDTLSITPLYTREQGIASQRNYVEFTLLPSWQGLVIVKKADATEVTPLRNGLRISLPKGAHVSPQLTGAQEAAEKALPAITSGTLFPDDLWDLEKGRSLKIALRNLFNQTVFSPNEGAKNLARLRMAQLYLREGFAIEALGLLDNINRTNPSYYRSAKLASMRGAANFLLYRFNDAARDFGAAELNNNIEVTYWRDLLADLLGSPGKVNNFMSMNDSYISKYPAVFRQRLAIVAADRAIAAKQYNVALQIFESLTKDDIVAPIQPYVDFLTAKISAENGQEAEAMEVWKRLAADSTNKFVQARASFSLILWQLDNNVITREQALDKLERLRLGWHGDGLELQVVQLLGDLYFEKQDYVNAMRVWQIGVTGFRNTGPAVEMGSKMEDTFAKLFNEGIADKMTPLEALALYYEYRTYTPAGAVGTQMIEKLVDRLIGVDLLSTAAQLLEQQMRTQMEKAERSRVGAKLADIYLLNNQPKRALRALQESVYGDNPILQRLHRNQLAAKAMVQLGRSDEALKVLGHDESIDAEKLRAMIYWDQKDWPNITTSIENMLKKRPDPTKGLDSEEGEFVLRLALAYVFQNDAKQVQYMRDYFEPMMRDNPYKQAFEFITAPDIKLTTRNFDDLLATLSDTRGFIRKYKARVALADNRTAAAAPPATPAAAPQAQP